MKIIVFLLQLFLISSYANELKLGKRILSKFIKSIQFKNYTLLSRIIPKTYNILNSDGKLSEFNREDIYSRIVLVPGDVSIRSVNVLKVEKWENGHLTIFANMSGIAQCEFRVRKKRSGKGYKIYHEIQTKSNMIPMDTFIINDTAIAWNVANFLNTHYVDSVRFKNLTSMRQVLVDPYQINFIDGWNKPQQHYVSHADILYQYTMVNGEVPVDLLIITEAKLYANRSVVFKAYQNRLDNVFVASPVGDRYKIVMERQLNVVKDSRPLLDGLLSMDGNC